MIAATNHARATADDGVNDLIDQTQYRSLRSSTMYLLNEDLARAHMGERRAEARRGARAARLARAQRLQRRAEGAAQRSRRATARTH